MGIPIMWITWSHAPYKHEIATATATYCFDTQEEAKAFLEEQSQDKTRTEAFYMAMPVFEETAPKLYDAGAASGYPGRKVSIPED